MCTVEALASSWVAELIAQRLGTVEKSKPALVALQSYLPANTSTAPFQISVLPEIAAARLATA